MSDRLVDIKAWHDGPNQRPLCGADISWLIAKVERLEAHSSYFVDGFAAGTEAAAKIADATAIEVDDGCSDRRMICESIATDIRAEIGDK